MKASYCEKLFEDNKTHHRSSRGFIEGISFFCIFYILNPYGIFLKCKLSKSNNLSKPIK